MKKEEMITLVKNIVEDACKSKNNAFGYGIWSHHIVHVVKYSKMLAREYNADEEIIELSALLHDYAGIKSIELYKDHHIHGAKEAEKILMKYDYDMNKINQVKNCIISHRASIINEQLTIEEKCLASADAMAHIKEIPSLLYYVYTKEKMEIDEGAKWVREKLKRSWAKLTDEAKSIVEKEYKSAMMVLS